MQEVARIVAIDGDVVTVVPLDVEACIGCQNAACRENGSVFSAVNTRRLEIRIGSEVRIASPVRSQLRQGFSALGIPVLAAAAAYILVSVFVPASGEGLRVPVALATLVAGMILTYALHRSDESELPEIVEVL
jgi:Positive regulator of sigma(E), RseC/MucC.